jgi:hypothetical protein
VLTFDPIRSLAVASRVMGRPVAPIASHPAGSGRTDPIGLGRVEVDALHPAEARHRTRLGFTFE